MTLIAVILVVLALNIPFGYWRDATIKFSFNWMLAIHLPVPIVAALRIYSGIGWQVHSFAFVVAAFFVGQYIGARLHSWMNASGRFNATGCMVMDVYRSIQK